VIVCVWYRLEVLFLSNNSLQEAPPALGCHPHLRVLSLRRNRLVALDWPQTSATATAPLEQLILTDNRIGRLPETLPAWRLRKLMLARNALEALPESFCRQPELELLRLSQNRLRALPACLFRMPKLAWLALASNPVTDGPEVVQGPSGVQLPWSALRLAQRLGEGTSGLVYQAVLLPNRTRVAVKIFKQSSSDGSFWVR
jgi:Leucine-rich repeat (LRR) protein